MGNITVTITDGGAPVVGLLVYAYREDVKLYDTDVPNMRWPQDGDDTNAMGQATFVCPNGGNYKICSIDFIGNAGDYIITWYKVGAAGNHTHDVKDATSLAVVGDTALNWTSHTTGGGVPSGSVSNMPAGSTAYVYFLQSDTSNDDCFLATLGGAAADGPYLVGGALPLDVTNVAAFAINDGSTTYYGWYDGVYDINEYDQATLFAGNATGIDFNYSQLPTTVVPNNAIQGKVGICESNRSHSTMGLLSGVYCCGECGTEVHFVDKAPIIFSRGDSVVLGVNNDKDEFADILLED